MRRRSFLILAAAMGTVEMALSSSQKKPVGIGLLGASHPHAEGKLEVLRSSPDFSIVGVCEHEPKLRQTLKEQDITLLSRKDLLRHPEIQVIAVESPVRDHATDGLAVLEAGKHLHLEKAPTDNMAAFQKIVELARKKDLLLQIGYMWRYNPGIPKAVEAAREGWLGSIYMVKATIGIQLAAGRRPELAEFAGGIMFELGGHLIDPLVRLMGRPRKVTPFLRKDGAFNDVLKDNTVAVLEWDRAIGFVQGSTLQPGFSRYRALEIHGTNGCAIVNPLEPPALTVDLATPTGPYPKGIQKIDVPPYRRYVDDFAELAAAVRGERKLRITYDEDLMVHEALLRCSGMF